MASERIQRRIDSLLDEAEVAIKQLDWRVVHDRAEAVLAIDPENADGLTYLATADRASGGSGPPDTTSSSPAAGTKSSTVDQPTTFANGRYRVKEFLGEGGKKKVYQAHDTTLDREVAFALIKTEGLDDTCRTRIQREAQAMGRLGSHPHIVTVFDLGQEQHQPYMVTELMSGGDVEGLIDAAANHRLALDQAINIAVETCRGLEFAHGRGIVHRDLKPGNVWLTADGVAKIGDFGLAVSLDRSRLTQEGMMVGTVSYMPPEQAMGGEVTPRSDLYSLGAMLYEMVTGRPPFLGDDSVAIIGQHINTPPVAPTWHNGQCPRPLEAVIMRLLTKNPSERPESAADVLSALEAIDLADPSVTPPYEGGVGGVDGSHAPSAGHSLDRLAGGVFVGRQREMGELKACLEDSLSGRGRIVTLVGEPGIGKTRTALELATYAGLRQAQVLWGRCYEGEGAPPYWPWVQAIRSYVRDVDPEQLRSEMGAGAADIGQVVSDVGGRLPGLEAPPQLGPEQARFRLFDSITAFLKSAGGRRPLVLVLDDLQWADRPSLLLLEFLAKELGNARLMIVGTYRDMELSRQHPLSQSLGELTRSAAGGFQRVLLRGLGQGDVGRFIELASGMTPPTGMVEAVHRQTEGNPLFVTEVVRLLAQEGHLAGDGGRGGSRTAPTVRDSDSWSVRIPEGVREVIGRRLDRLSERCNETLTVASVVGREFTVDQLAPLIEDISRDRVLEVLEEALSSRVIEELPRAVGRYQFTHALIQETLAGELSLTRRVRLHARIAEALEKLYEGEESARSAELAYHFAQAQEVLGTERLVRYSLMAGQRGLASYAYEEALEHFQRVLDAKENDETDAEAADALFGLGRAQAALARIEDAIPNFKQAFDYYFKTRDVENAVAIGMLPLHTWPGRLGGALELCSRALELVDESSLDAGRLFSNQGQVLGLQVGDYVGSQEAFGSALDIARQHGDKGLEMRTLAIASFVDLYHLRPPDALEKSSLVEALARDVDDPVSQVVTHFTTGILQLFAGDADAGLQHAQAAVPPAERVRDRLSLARAYGLSAVAHYVTGNWSLSREYGDRSLTLVPSYPPALYSCAMLEYLTGNFEEGEDYLNRLLDAVGRNPPGPSLERACVAVTASEFASITGDSHWSQVAQDAGSEVLDSPGMTPLLLSTFTRAGLAILEAQRENPTRGSELYASLEFVPQSWLLAVIPRILGLLAQTIGKLEDAAAHFEDALAFCRKAGYRPDLARTCCDYADLLLDPGEVTQGRGGSRTAPTVADRAKANALLDESLAISSELGMRPLMERVLSRREILRA